MKKTINGQEINALAGVAFVAKYAGTKLDLTKLNKLDEGFEEVQDIDIKFEAEELVLQDDNLLLVEWNQTTQKYQIDKREVKHLVSEMDQKDQDFFYENSGLDEFTSIEKIYEVESN